MKQHNTKHNLINRSTAKIANLIVIFLLIQPCSVAAFSKNDSGDNKFNLWENIEEFVLVNYYDGQKDGKKNADGSFSFNYNLGRADIRIDLPVWLEGLNRAQYGLSFSYRF